MKEKKLENYLQSLTKEQLIDEYLRMNDFAIELEKFMIEALGKVTYDDLIKEFALKRSTEWLKAMGVSDKETQEFRDLFSKEEKKS